MLLDSDSIILSVSLFGSIYLFSTSIAGINNKWIKDGEAQVTAFEILNGSIMLLSGGGVLLTSFKAYQLISNK